MLPLSPDLRRCLSPAPKLLHSTKIYAEMILYAERNIINCGLARCRRPLIEQPTNQPAAAGATSVSDDIPPPPSSMLLLMMMVVVVVLVNV